MTEVEAQGKLEMLHDCKMASAIPNRNLWSYLSSLLRLPPPPKLLPLGGSQSEPHPPGRQGQKPRCPLSFLFALYPHGQSAAGGSCQFYL